MNHEPQDISQIILQLREEIQSLKLNNQSKDHNTKEDAYFDLTAYLGMQYTSMYLLSLMWSGEFEKNPQYNTIAQELKTLLYSTQLKNGSWFRVLDKNLTDPGDLSATILNYWFLKAIGEDVKSDQLVKARNYILEKGGLEKSDMLTKIFLANFGHYPWKKIPPIPYIVFNKILPINEKKFAAWLGPHILPMSILRNIKAFKSFSPEKTEKLSLNELQFPLFIPTTSDQKITHADKKMIQKLLLEQRPKGSWGGYVLASIFGNMALSHVRDLNKNITEKNKLQLAANKAQLFLNQNMLFPHYSRLLGPTQDGHIWDTTLLAGALLESGSDSDDIRPFINHLKLFQQSNGGFPFGYDFESTPDVDDTAEIMITFSRYSSQDEVKTSLQKAIKYISSMQNKDGGFAAFSKNNTGNFLLTFLTKGFQDSADLYDESSPDVTGHVLEALGRLGYNIHNSDVVKKAIQYLRKNQQQSGEFEGRWGINYIYGTSAVLVGLNAVGLSKNDPLIKRGLQWILSKQNADGGFGESTLSYNDINWRGRGLSTPTQSSLALLALLNLLPVNDPQIEKTIHYLSEAFYSNPDHPTFEDPSVTGTGHPKVCYMVYPVYAKTFPLIALSRYQELKKKL